MNYGTFDAEDPVSGQAGGRTGQGEAHGEDFEEMTMYQITQDELLFLGAQPGMIPIYEALAGKLFARYPDTRIKVSKSQISFYNRHLYACASFARVKKKAELPENWFVLTLGLNYPLESPRVAVKTEPYSGRWTTHIVISTEEDLDEELLGWIQQAYDFAQNK